VNDDDRPVSYGQRTGLDEMCYAYLTYYPKITDPTWDWNAPAENANCIDSPVPRH
jgi:hypothetical protein